MNEQFSFSGKLSTAHGRSISRRQVLVGGAITGAVGALGLSSLNGGSVVAANSDVAILNAAIDLENQAIWAYGVAGGKLSNTAVGQTVLALATRNRADHVQHCKALSDAVKNLGGTPSPARNSYDLSSYIQAGEGNLDSDANIAKLALALEYDAALAYIDAFSKLESRALIAAAGTIGPAESAHVTAIRAVFKTLDPKIEYVPAPFVSSGTRSDWVLKV